MTPENELGVIVLFAQQAEAAGFEIVSISGAFPDALVTKGGNTYRAEFEYQATNFKSHKHDVRKCDLIIAWVNDWPSCILPVLALSESTWVDTALVLPNELERKAAYWEQRARLAEARLRQMGDEGAKADHRARNKTRQRLLLFYAKNPMATQAQVAQALGVTRQAIGQQLDKLEAEGIIKRDGQGVDVLGNDNQQRALAILATDPGISGAELGRRLGLSERQGRNLRAELSPEIDESDKDPAQA